LLHVVVELDAVPLGVEGIGRVVHAWVELRGDQAGLDSDSVFAQERDGLAELAIVRDLNAE
jgi:hypothetical protein